MTEGPNRCIKATECGATVFGVTTECQELKQEEVSVHDVVLEDECKKNDDCRFKTNVSASSNAIAV